VQFGSRRTDRRRGAAACVNDAARSAEQQSGTFRIQTRGECGFQIPALGSDARHQEGHVRMRRAQLRHFPRDGCTHDQHEIAVLVPVARRVARHMPIQR